ncbi:pyridoxamine 5'-phosphate oxidase family protein [Halothiobacillus sp. DCM-1]|uniref:pyridoxamine 5'-phosphate oxidase family protein n=1 Tax=Halothiobacillus sp. DCM-1 TaxID=3112558 RepID=UPI003251AB00
MAKRYPQLEPAHEAFIRAQRVYFVATATADSRINLSPKGLDSLRILSPTRLLWLNLTGSGNESAAHVRLNPRMTLMFCAFDEPPLILRLYGRAQAIHPRDTGWATLHAQFPNHPGARQIFDFAIDEVQTSCGFGVPLMTGAADRPTLNQWAEKKGSDGIARYWQDKNQFTIDQLPTGILADPLD